MAWTAGTGRGDKTTSATDVSVSLRRTSESCGPAPNGSKQPRIDPCIEIQATSHDTSQCLELLAVESSRKDLKACITGSISSEEASKMIQPIHQLANQPELIHRFSALMPMQTDQLVPGSNVVISWRLDLSLRSPASHELFNDLLTKLTGNGLTLLISVRLRPLGPSSGPVSQALRTALLQLCLGNDANDYNLNTLSIAELWACCMDSHFSWDATGDW